MKFYNRKNELKELKRIQELSFNQNSRMTVLTGRRRIGKTSLILKAMEGTPTVYLFVGRKNEADLCSEFIPIISQSLNAFVPTEITSFRSLFQYLMELATRQKFNLIIDEFQEFFNINESVFSDIQNIWDSYRQKTNLNLVVSGSVYALIKKIFQDKKEPLFGRADNIIKLTAFDTETLKEIMQDNHPKYTNDDLLALYTFTGGIPKYVELFVDNKYLSVQEMIAFMVRDNSPFIEEGKHLLIEEFGKNYGTYFSILGAISGGINTQAQIESRLGDKNLGGQLKRLIEDYEVISRIRPIKAKTGSHTIRFEIQDNFLKFWFHYFHRFRSMIEIRNFEGLQAIVSTEYEHYSGKILERYFNQKLAESKQFKEIGSWWELKKEQNEIDIVALKIEKDKALAIEVKRHKKNFKPTVFAEKVKQLKNKVLFRYTIETQCLSLNDM